MLKNIALGLLGLALLLTPLLHRNLALLSALAFAPLLWAEARISQSKNRSENWQWLLVSALFCLGWLGISQYHKGSFNATSWLSYGATLTLALMLFKFVKDHLGQQRGYISLPFLWVSAEAAHYYQSLGASPFPLAENLAKNSATYDWQAYVGLFGLSLWTVICGLLAYAIVAGFLKHQKTPVAGLQALFLVVVALVLPLLFSPSTANKPAKTPVETTLNPQAELSETQNLQDQEDPRLIPTRPHLALAKADRFLARLSFFIAGFLVLFAFVKGFLDKRKTI
jgi:apolipoprotein N-acyltransferase